MKKWLLATVLGMVSMAAQAQTYAIIETNVGNIELLLDEQKSP